MHTEYFSLNGTLLPISEAQIPISNIEYSYGFGVYETLRVSNGILYFTEQHINRLLESARLLQLEHTFTKEGISLWLEELKTTNKLKSSNIKMLLIGASSSDQAKLYIQTLNPRYPDRKGYSSGVHCITYEYERFLPHAKSLNMLQGYLAYREASKEHAYDALLINRQGEITEGSRTNFFCIAGTTIISPPEKDILLGVMRSVMLRVAEELNYKIEERPIKANELHTFEGAFLTSTSSKIMPISSIGSFAFKDIPGTVRVLMNNLQTFLDSCDGTLLP